MIVNLEMHYAIGQFSNEFQSNFIFIYLEQSLYLINKILLKKKSEAKEMKQMRYPALTAIMR